MMLYGVFVTVGGLRSLKYDNRYRACVFVRPEEAEKEKEKWEQLAEENGVEHKFIYTILPVEVREL